MRLKGIDSIRFICAIVVLFGHLQGPPFFYNLDSNIFFFKIIQALYANTFNGAAAVIVFFLISGLVIHFPYVEGKKLNIPEFYLKRYIRIGIPMLAITIIAYAIGKESSLEVFWSLYAELIYYTLYPLIIIIKQKFGIKAMIIVSFIISYLIIYSVPYKDFQNYVDVGIYFTWIIGLPVWLLGVYLAEYIKSVNIIKEKINLRKLWFFRIGIFLISILLQIAKFHLHLKYSVSLNLFSLLIFIWLVKELVYYKTHEPNPTLENAGKWSYSLYICHILGMNLMNLYFVGHTSNYFLSWITMIGFILIFSYVFYLIIEKPSHILTKKVNLN